VLNHYDLGLYVESCLKSFEISGLPGLWEPKYINLITSVIVFVLTFLLVNMPVRCYGTKEGERSEREADGDSSPSSLTLEGARVQAHESWHVP
jgi:hypothetical protein